MCLNVYSYVFLWMSTHLCICVGACRACTCMSVCVCVCVRIIFVCLCVHKQALLWDGFDERTNAHTDPSLAKKQMLELFHDAVGKLDEVRARTYSLSHTHRARTQSRAWLLRVVVSNARPFHDITHTRRWAENLQS